MSVSRRFPEDLRKNFARLQSWNSFAKVQDGIDALPMNFEPHGITLRSPLMVLEHRKAHCIEGALLAAAAFWYHGGRPLVLDLRTTRQKPEEFDHVVALFKYKGRWGAVSKTNHAVLRYREPVYRDVRELAMSYFHEYFLDTGQKTLREYSRPFDLSSLGASWLTRRDDLWDVESALDEARHYSILPPGAEKRLRLAHPVERAAGKIVEWQKEKGRAA
jgi:hypothetical protein